MKVVHYTAYNGSGMNAVARQFADNERRIGVDAHVVNIHESSNWDIALDADIHVAHTHFPDFFNGKSFTRMLKKPLKIVTVFHGTPEFVFRETLNNARHNPKKHGQGDGVMMMMHWLARADARVTMWPRHQALFRTMVDRGTDVHLVPMGVDRKFWGGGVAQREEWPGRPSLFSAENAHMIKDPLDLVMMWPWVYEQLEGASLHLCYLPENLHRYYGPLMMRNHAAYGMHWSALYFSPLSLRNILKSVDFFIGLVRYGDHNHLSQQANAAGARTISYAGNPYSDYWITEGDQRQMAQQLLSILNGTTLARTKTEVPDAIETARAMKAIYAQTLKRVVVPGFTLPFAECTLWGPGTGQVVDTRTPAVKASSARSAQMSGAVDTYVEAIGKTADKVVRKLADRMAGKKKAQKKTSKRKR